MEQTESMNSKIKNFFLEYRCINKVTEKLKNTLETLSNENIYLKEKLKRSTQEIHESINKTISSESSHLLYINLRDKYDLLLKEIESVKQEKEILVKHYEEKILTYKNEVENERKHFEFEKNEFNENLQVYQASAALENDELESKWQARLDIVNQQLKDSNMSCNTLRNQLVDLKNRFLYSNTDADKRIQDLEQALIMSEEKLRKAEEKLIAKQHIGVPTFGRGAKSKLYANSRPYVYDLGRRNPHSESFANRSFDSNVSSRHYEPLPVNNFENNLNNAGELNKSIPQDEMEKSPRTARKRKLYNLDDF